MTTATQTSIEELRFRLSGGLHEPGDPEFEDACTLYSSAIDKRPRFVARCASADDVVAVLAFAREHDAQIAVRAGGHSVTGASLVEDGIVLDVRPMCDVDVDPERRVARVGGGATWSHVDRATQEHGLATTGGRVSTTGVAGLTMGGGSGWLERKHGLACDNLIAAELVTASGELVRASADENPDLLYALRGGGANFGVVTAMEFQLHPLPETIFAGFLLHHADRGREALAAYRDAMLNGPDELGLALMFFTAPDEDEIPADLRGRPCVLIGGLYAGSVEDGEKAMRGIREFAEPAVDFFGPTTYADFQCSLDDPPGFRNYWTAENLVEVPDEAIDAVVARAAELPEGGASQIFIVCWGGRVADGAEGSPIDGRDTKMVVHPLLLWEDPAEDDEMIAFGRGFHDVFRQWTRGAAYLNFVGDEGTGRVKAGFRDGAYERVLEVKRAFDPDNVFQGNQSLRA
jgi:FAD/FMN-containing dehydrogenase